MAKQFKSAVMNDGNEEDRDCEEEEKEEEEEEKEEERVVETDGGVSWKCLIEALLQSVSACSHRTVIDKC